eukprot:scaffold6811_cov126-Isochrysis_galbana.AAC.6
MDQMKWATGGLRLCACMRLIGMFAQQQQHKRIVYSVVYDFVFKVYTTCAPVLGKYVADAVRPTMSSDQAVSIQPGPA